ncbi:hypothetical protein [Niabella drilacis]|nr:hypothetical protein [Niabella drilacis]
MYLFARAILLCCVITACQKNTEEQNLPKETPVLKLWAGADSTTSLSTWELTGNSFTISNDHPDIAEVTTDHKNITVRAHKPGKATITLINEQHKQFKLLVRPVDLQSDIPGNWVSVADGSMKSYVTVKTGDPKLTDSLYNVLWKKLEDNGNTGSFRYAFTGNNVRFAAGTTSPINKEGTWTYDRLRLTLSYAGAQETYQVIPLRSIYLIELRSTLTAELQQRFPDAGITEVSTHQYWVYHRFL